MNYENELHRLFVAFTEANNFPEGDALELLMFADLTEIQRHWISAFVALWEASENV